MATAQQPLRPDADASPAFPRRSSRSACGNLADNSSQGFDRLFSIMGSGRDWLLFEVLGAEPVVVAQGYRLRKLIPISLFLSANRNLGAITRAIADTIQQRQSLVLPGAEQRELIHCRPVIMTDEVVHGVHVWTGKPDVRPPARAGARGHALGPHDWGRNGHRTRDR